LLTPTSTQGIVLRRAFGSVGVRNGAGKSKKSPVENLENRIL